MHLRHENRKGKSHKTERGKCKKELFAGEHARNYKYNRKSHILLKLKNLIRKQNETVTFWRKKTLNHICKVYMKIKSER